MKFITLGGVIIADELTKSVFPKPIILFTVDAFELALIVKSLRRISSILNFVVAEL
jgi:hypothetical protein